MKKAALIFILLTTFACPAFSQHVKEITPQEAFKKLEGPSTYLIDVRSIAEYVFVGHPDTAFNIPLLFWSEKEQKLVPNENFLEDIQARFKKEDVLIFICRSGGRSLKAAEMAYKVGFANVFSINEGFEGTKDERGRRTVNGWKNRNLPYSYKLNKELIYEPRKQDKK